MVHKEKVTSIVERRIYWYFLASRCHQRGHRRMLVQKPASSGRGLEFLIDQFPSTPYSALALFASTLLILLYRSIAEYLHRHRPVGMHALYDCKYLCRVRKRAFGRGLCVVGREKENISCALFVFSFLKKSLIPQSTTQPFRVGLSAFVRACVF